jgi:caffeoyl-CoA O-methyltransferase
MNPLDKSRAYCFMDIVAKEAEEYAATHTTPLSPLLEEIENFTLTQTAYPSMLTGRVEGRFLQMIARLSGATKIVEIGTFTGYSALAMADAVPQNGSIITVEHNAEHAAIAKRFIDRSQVGYKIDLRIGDGLEILKGLPDEQTDLVFIDADKTGYRAYYEESIRILKTGGLVLADNALWYGRIFNPQDDDSRAMAEFNEVVNSDSRAEKLFLTIRDGIYLIRKRSH